MPASSEGGIGSSMYSQITVRSFGSALEADAVVDQPDPAVLAEQAVPPFAVGVVDHEIERGHRTEVLDEPLLQA